MFAATGDEFATISAGKVELRAGPNTIEVTRGWGYFDVDYVELVPAAINRKLMKPPSKPVDPEATKEARKLLSTLIGAYGSKNALRAIRRRGHRLHC